METLRVKIVTEKVLKADKVAARIVKNHFGLQSLDFMFVFDVELPDEEAREMAPRDSAKSRLRRLVRTLHASLVGRDEKRLLTGMIEESIVSSTSDDVTHLVDYVASALNGVTPRKRFAATNCSSLASIRFTRDGENATPRSFGFGYRRTHRCLRQGGARYGLESTHLVSSARDGCRR